MMSMALDIDSNKGMQDYGRLLAQNKALHSELTQCQADKEFVWSLWKRLQVSNPDVTEAISLVIQREKEKAEAKDLKVLEILQVKDDRIEELQNIVAKQSQEISELLTKKLDLQEKCGRLQAEAERASDQLTGLELKVRGQETKERSMDDTYRRTVEESQREKYELQRKVTTLTTELEVAKEERAGVTAKRLELERTVRNLERDVSEKVSRFDGLISELEDTRRRAEKAERQVQQLNHEVDFKNQELESIRKELKELWNSHNQMTDHSAQQAQLIQQLQSLQHDTHIMIKNQEDAFSVETRSMQQMYQDVCGRYESAKQVESDLRQQILVLKKELLDREDEVNRLQEQTKAMCEQLTQTDRASPFLDADLAAADRSTLEARRDLAALRQLEKTIEKLDQSMDQDRDATLEFDVSHSRRSARHSTPSRDDGSESGGPVARRARSLSPQSYRREAVEKQRNDQQRVSDLQKLLELKDKELEAIRRAHANRLERLRSVQRSEKLLQEQIKTYEEHQPSRKKKKVQRSDPRQLQRENSDAAWNELSYFKAQHRKLEVERVSLQEEVDELRVQASMDAATLHELRVRLQAQTEEFEYQLKKSQQTKASQSDMEGELLMLRSRVQNKDAHIGRLEKDLQEMTADRDALLEEKKTLKNQTNKLQQELSQSRIQIADLKHDLQRKQHALEESLQLQEVQGLSAPVQPPTGAESAVPGRRKPTHRFKKSGVSSSSVKQYQRTLNRSIEKMSGLFSNFPEEGWEEMSDTGETEEEEEEADTEATADSLGVAIVHQAQRHPGVSDSSVDATPSTGHRASPVRPTTSKTQGRGKMQTKPRRTPRKAKNMQKGPSKPSEGLQIHIPSPDRPDSERRSRSRSRSPVTARERVVLREVATSPVSWSHREEEETTPARTAGAQTGGHQLSVLKRRIAYLTRQLAVLRATRAVGLKKFAELKANNEQLTSDMNQAHQRLRNAKLTCQRLSADVERLQREKQNLDQQLSVKDRSEEAEKHSDGDRRLLEARLKMSTSEVTRQAAMIRSLKTELDTLQDQNRSLQDRVNHLERDNNQKRNLVESQRIKLKASQDATKIHDDTMEELQTKVKLSAENVEKMRIQLDSLKKRMRVVTQEKRDYEDKYLQASLSLEKKTKELSIVREQRSQLESAMSQLESLSQKQLQRVASHSEAAVDAAQAQVSATHSMLAQYQQFVKLLCGELLDRVARTRGQLREAAAVAAAREEQARADHDSDTASLKRAQDTARDILNISQSDLEDIMSADGDHAAQESSFAQEGKRDKKWLRKCEKVIGSKEEFVRPLVSLILQKVDERADLLMRLTSS